MANSHASEQGLSKIGHSEYTGRWRPLFNISLVTTLLTLLSFGIYRFWARTRIRNYMWSSIKIDDTPLEYTGRGLEKLLGFLIAVAVLAIYLGLLQLLLTFVGFSLIPDFESNQVDFGSVIASYIAFFALLPLIFYAQYRARRYILSRSRWRGIRFGAQQAAWGYVWTALRNLGVTIITLGILLPRQTFNLEKYKTDRSWYGNARFAQNGKWQMLFPAMKHFYIGLGIILAAGIVLVVAVLNQLAFIKSGLGPNSRPGSVWIFVALFGLLIGYFWWQIGYWIYQVASWRIMANHKTLGDKIGFSSTVRTGAVIKARILGFILAFAIAFVVSILVGILTWAIGGAIIQEPELVSFDNAPSTAEIIALTIGYLAFILALSVLVLVTVTQPVLAIFVRSIDLDNLAALEEIAQREGDDFVEAEGFADALDIGAGL